MTPIRPFRWPDRPFPMPPQPDDSEGEARRPKNTLAQCRFVAG